MAKPFRGELLMKGENVEYLLETNSIFVRFIYVLCFLSRFMVKEFFVEDISGKGNFCLVFCLRSLLRSIFSYVCSLKDPAICLTLCSKKLSATFQSVFCAWNSYFFPPLCLFYISSLHSGIS